MRLWRCPQCGSGVRAPERPRKNDVRRFCRDCSWSTGFLVERSIPARDRQREVKAQLRQTRRQAAVTRAREAALLRLLDANGTEHRIDIYALVDQAKRDMGYTGKIDLSVHQRQREGMTGHASPDRWPHPRIHLSVPDGGEYERALELAYHEVAHIVSGASIKGSDRRWHGPKFRRTLADGLQKRWPFLRYGSVRSGAAYDADDRIVEQLKDNVRSGGVL